MPTDIKPNQVLMFSIIRCTPIHWLLRVFVLSKADVAAQVFNSSADRRGNVSTLLNIIDPDVTLVFIYLLKTLHSPLFKICQRSYL